MKKHRIMVRDEYESNAPIHQWGLPEMDKRIYSGLFAFTYPETRMASYPFWTKEEMETQMVLISGKSPEIRRIQGFKSIRVEMTLSNKAGIQSKS